MVFSGEFQLFAVACRPRLSSIPDLGAGPPSQACPRPAVKSVLTNAGFQCCAFGFADLDHLSCVRAGQLTPAGEAAAATNLREILNLAHCPNLLVATLATLPSMSLIPSAPFAHSLFSFRHCPSTMAGVAPALQFSGTNHPSSRRMINRICRGWNSPPCRVRLLNTDPGVRQRDCEFVLSEIFGS